MSQCCLYRNLLTVSVEKNCVILAWKKKIMLDESFPRTRASEARRNELYGSPNSGVIGGGGGGLPIILPIIAYMGRLRPKGVSFSGFRFIKGRDFTR